MKDSTIEQWVAELKAAYPHLPDHLSIDIEKDRLAKLEVWFRRVQRLRVLYDQVDPNSLTEELKSAGKRQIVPVLLSLHAMTDEEITAWHELFVCLSAMLADIAYDYYKTHLMGRTSALTLMDVLNYLPVVFLYVLSSYDATRGSAKHEENFSREAGRVRLITWVYRDARRHINGYMQQHVNTVRRGSAVHRLRSQLLQAYQHLSSTLEHDPSRQEVLAYMRKTHDVDIELDDELYNIIMDDHTLSLDTPVSGDTTQLFSDTLTSEVGDVESHYDPIWFAMKLAGGDKNVENALIKLFETEEPLSVAERYAIGV